MQISEQIRLRRESLGLSLKQLADMVNVSEQAVRHWESGRSLPGRSNRSDLEKALRFNLDWSEGRHQVSSADRPKGLEMLSQRDVDFLVVLAKLPARSRDLIEELARTQLKLVEALRKNNLPLPESTVAQEKMNS